MIPIVLQPISSGSMIPAVCALNSGISSLLSISSGISHSGVSPLLFPTVCALGYGVSRLLPISPGISHSHSQRRIASFCGRSSWKPALPNIKLSSSSSPPLPNIKLSSPLGIASKPFQSSWFHVIPVLPKRRLLPSAPRANKHKPQGSMTREARFRWRILACIPYCFQEIWFIGETARHIQDFKFCINCPFVMSLGRIPRWFAFFSFFAYLFVIVVGAVNRKECPYFFRFHVDMSLLLGMLFLPQIAGSWVYLSQSVWVFIAFAFMVVVLECMRCALCGMHPDVPFLSHMVEQGISDPDT